MSGVTRHGMEKNGGTVPEGGLVRIWLALNSPTYDPATSPGDTFDLDSFNLHFEVLCRFYRLDWNVSDAVGITESINVKDFSGKRRRLGDKQQLN